MRSHSTERDAAIRVHRRPPCVPRAILLPLLPLLAGLAWGCRSERAPRVVTAEFLDEKNLDGQASGGETIRITLDHPLPGGVRPEDIRVWTGPPREQLLVRPRPGSPGSRTLEIELLSTPSPLLTAGSFAGDPDARAGPSGLGIDFGPAAPGAQWVDLQECRGFPLLKRAVWEDRPAPGAAQGNLIVDQGDWIRLYFVGPDQSRRPVRLAGPGPASGTGLPSGKGAAGTGGAGEPPVQAQVPADILLAKPGDQLDDGKAPSVLLEGSEPDQIVIVLGSNPRLTIAGRHRPPFREEGTDALDPLWPSGIAVNGTPFQPMAKITDRRGRPGAISRGSVDIEFRENYFFSEKRTDEPFPPPGHRAHPTVTGIAGGRAVVAGGRTAEGKPLSQVLIYSPEAARPLQSVGEMLEPRYLHTATLFPGEDGVLWTYDDFLVIAGGTDGERSLQSLVVVRLDPNSPDQVTVEPIAGSLHTPRMYHTAVLIPPDRLLVEGGRSYSRLGGGIVPTAELLVLESRGGKISARQERVIPVPPRMRHTSTYLGRGNDGFHYVLDYGGFGFPRERIADPAQPFFSHDEGMVLGSPELLRIESGPLPPAGAPATSAERPDGPRVEALPLEFDYRFEMLRYDHRAVSVGFEPASIQGEAPREVLIAGGALHPPNFDPLRPGRKLFEPPRRQDDAAWLTRDPTYSETAAAISFEFHPSDPAKSGFRVVESPTGDRRAHCALVPLGRRGVLVLGGENPQRPEEVSITAEIYLPAERRLFPLAIPLAAPRTRFGAFVVEWPGGTTVYILGGSSSAGGAPDFSDVERLRIDDR